MFAVKYLLAAIELVIALWIWRMKVDKSLSAIRLPDISILAAPLSIAKKYLRLC